ncbi:unnamed protein product [Orchesella dallaii]|uniref:NAD(+) diphosphatase n=1 Tax=Orchesella dallaii TaxID=48710 RepID=A0ABP1QRJ6_9HEXA
MPWPLARMARYVQQCKYLQQLKDNDDICSKAFERGSYLLFSKEKPLLTRKDQETPFQSVISWRTFHEVEPFNPNVKQSSVVLGVSDEADIAPLFVCSVPPETEKKIESAFNSTFVDMRRALFSLSDDENQHVSRGYSMISWDENIKFCSYCGSSLDRKISGCSKVCSQKCNPLKMTHYPQIHPVAITRVLNHSLDKILLVRQPRHPKGMYSCIAGFMEPGETLNDNIRREIAEEVGIVVEKIEYFQSQAWPLPQPSLMMACTAVAMPGSEEIDIDKEELEDAKWFSKAETQEALTRVIKNPKILRENEKGELVIPPHGAIAHELVKNWLNQYTPTKL